MTGAAAKRRPAWRWPDRAAFDADVARIGWAAELLARRPRLPPKALKAELGLEGAGADHRLAWFRQAARDPVSSTVYLSEDPFAHLSTRARNALRNASAESWADVAPDAAAFLRWVPRAGRATIAEIEQARRDPTRLG